MKHYRCKHAVEAMRWDGTSRELLTAWHETRSGLTPWFLENTSTPGAVSVRLGDTWHVLKPTEWLVWSSGEFLVMDDEQMRETYEPANPSSGPLIP